MARKQLTNEAWKRIVDEERRNAELERLLHQRHERNKRLAGKVPDMRTPMLAGGQSPSPA